MSKSDVTVYEGGLNAEGLKFGIVCARFNEIFTGNLLDGALDIIERHGGDRGNVDVAWVPGSFEIPLIARKMAASGDYDAVIGIGVVIQGATAHADHINSSVASAFSNISQDTGVPVIYGVVTAENLEQAMERCGAKLGNRGTDAARTAIEMAHLVKQIDNKG